MSALTLLFLITAVGLFVYLLFALFKPEWF
ncbi:hypothetical protein BH09SUM1_BH09SUM1_27890 [soil metagenome]